jgi:hypothetical protein
VVIYSSCAYFEGTMLSIHAFMAVATTTPALDASNAQLRIPTHCCS